MEFGFSEMYTPQNKQDGDDVIISRELNYKKNNYVKCGYFIKFQKKKQNISTVIRFSGTGCPTALLEN